MQTETTIELHENNNLQSTFRQRLFGNDEKNECTRTVKNQMDQFIKNIETELRFNICFEIFTKVMF